MNLSRRQVLGLAAAVISAACRDRSPLRTNNPRPDAAPATRTDATDAGPPARRIVSLVPNVTEMLFALGAGDRVVGVSALCDLPPEVTRLPRVGTMVNPSTEAILALNPDAVVGVLGPYAPAALDPIRRRGVRMLFPSVETLADVRAALRSLAALVGDPAAADRFLARMDAELAQVREKVQGRRRVRAVVVVSETPSVVAGHGSWTDEMFTLAGGENPVANVNRFPALSREQVLGATPEVIVDLTSLQGATATLESVWTADAGAPIPDAAPLPPPGRFVRLTDTALIRPGPRVVEAVKLAGRALHPDLAW